jgi:hypothetical protein
LLAGCIVERQVACYPAPTLLQLLGKARRAAGLRIEAGLKLVYDGEDHVQVADRVRRRRDLLLRSLLFHVEHRSAGVEDPPVDRERQRLPRWEHISRVRGLQHRDDDRDGWLAQTENLSVGREARKEDEQSWEEDQASYTNQGLSPVKTILGSLQRSPERSLTREMQVALRHQLQYQRQIDRGGTHQGIVLAVVEVTLPREDSALGHSAGWRKTWKQSGYARGILVEAREVRPQVLFFALDDRQVDRKKQAGQDRHQDPASGRCAKAERNQHRSQVQRIAGVRVGPGLR